MNPCRCGFRGDPGRSCVCGPLEVERYLSRLSGPLLDRIDIHIEVPAVPYRDLSVDRSGEPSTVIRERVNKARALQQERFARRIAQQVSARALIDRLKERGKTVVVGGPDATSSAHLYDAADQLVLGEGEVTWPRWVAAFKAGCAAHVYPCGDEKADMALSPVP